MKKMFLPFAFIAITSFTQAEKSFTEKVTTNDINNRYFPFNDLDNIPSAKFLNKYFSTTILDELFNNFTDNGWTTYSVSGTRIWEIISFGNPAPAAFMNGFGGVNEDWLISKNIDLTNNYTSASFSFQTDGRYTGNQLEVYISTDTYINGTAPNTVTWAKLNATFDSDMNSFGGFVPSGDIDLTAYLGKNVRIAFKYTNDTPSIASVWEIDNFKVVASENLGVANAFYEKMKLYPNPVGDILNFSEEVTNVKITDISGRIVNEAVLKGKSMNTSKLKKGIYIVIATVKSGETITNKIVKD